LTRTQVVSTRFNAFRQEEREGDNELDLATWERCERAALLSTAHNEKLTPVQHAPQLLHSTALPLPPPPFAAAAAAEPPADIHYESNTEERKEERK